jgi:carbamoyl-phosphate synthase large subunit
MRIIYTVDELTAYLHDLYGAAPGGEVDLREAPLLIDRFLEGAVEVDIDAVYDGAELYVGGVMEHVEEAGVHSGDSACVVPPPSLPASTVDEIVDYAGRLARGLRVRGLLNIQFAVRGDEVFVLEANPRASRTVPFISKATDVPLAKVATRVMMGETLGELRAAGLLPAERPSPGYVAVKEAVLPWSRFPAEDTVLGPEMRATGEVMGIGVDVGIAYAKALLAAGHEVPAGGTLFLSLADRDKAAGVEAASIFSSAGFRILATHGTAGHLARNGIGATHVDKVGEGPYDPIRLIEDGEIHLVVNTPRGQRARGDGGLIRRAANRHGVACATTIQGGMAIARSLQAGGGAVTAVRSLQSHHQAARHG